MKLEHISILQNITHATSEETKILDEEIIKIIGKDLNEIYIKFDEIFLGANEPLVGYLIRIFKDNKEIYSLDVDKDGNVVDIMEYIQQNNSVQYYIAQDEGVKLPIAFNQYQIELRDEEIYLVSPTEDFPLTIDFPKVNHKNYARDFIQNMKPFNSPKDWKFYPLPDYNYVLDNLDIYPLAISNWHYGLNVYPCVVIPKLRKLVIVHNPQNYDYPEGLAVRYRNGELECFVYYDSGEQKILYSDPERIDPDRLYELTRNNYWKVIMNHTDFYPQLLYEFEGIFKTEVLCDICNKKLTENFYVCKDCADYEECSQCYFHSNHMHNLTYINKFEELKDILTASLW